MTTDVKHVLRALCRADAPAAAALIRAAFAAQALQTDPPSSALKEDDASIAAALEEGGGGCAEAPSGMVGAVLWRQTETGLYLGRLAVHPDWRGQGIARALVALAEEEARRLGCARLHLGVRLVLEDNRRLFRSCGFVEGDQHAHPGYDMPTSVDMEKVLA
jgi:GNAT superfamily N-acetyltransferase